MIAGDLKEIANELRALADELVDEFAAGHLDERRVRLGGDGLRHHRLPRAGRTIQKNAARRLDADVPEEIGVLHREFDGLADFAELLGETADVLVADRRRLLDLHDLRADVGLVVQPLHDREAVVDGDARAGFEVVAEFTRDLRERLLIVPVLLDDRSAVVHLLDRGDEQRGLLELLVLVGEAFELLLVLVVLGVRVEELVAHLLVLLLEDVEALPEGLDLLLLRRPLLVREFDVVDGVTHRSPLGR
ncbi:hypothetical protein MBEHAL_0108 [Halarchaeum acidiphilum MH1-52-1]|uniref:Uncharacterized protein n=1 Tax=Halarchaeum acidiphilum MH1-52-1 TaxID=1261545 RepID=U3A9C9_9EURY|nr:hypothetical protein MBEHAL_0108 [Halarchaeum acidiphilum MH1-52-1]